MVDERIAERRRDVREQQRRRRLQRTVAVTVLLALVVVLLVLERSPLVELAEVRVVGTDVLTPARVREAADLELGTSLLRLPIDDAAARVRALPRVASAQVDRVDPVTVRITVEERVPTMAARKGDDWVLVDDEGVVLARGRLSGLPTIVVRQGDLPPPGGRVGANPALANAVAFERELPGPTRSRVAAVRAEAEDRAVLVLREGTLVEVGRATDVAAKARSLAAVLEDLDDRVVSVIDVRAPNAPVFTQ